VSARILERDQQRQLERFDQADPADLLRRRLGDEQVPALKRPPKAVRRQRANAPYRLPRPGRSVYCDFLLSSSRKFPGSCAMA
jgi:hypothetical protein